MYTSTIMQRYFFPLFFYITASQNFIANNEKDHVFSSCYVCSYLLPLKQSQTHTSFHSENTTEKGKLFCSHDGQSRQVAVDSIKCKNSSTTYWQDA